MLLDERSRCAGFLGRDGDLKQGDPGVEPEIELCLSVDRGGAEEEGNTTSPEEIATEGNWNTLVLDFALTVSIIRKSMVCCLNFVCSSFASFLLK